MTLFLIVTSHIPSLNFIQQHHPVILFDSFRYGTYVNGHVADHVEKLGEGIPLSIFTFQSKQASAFVSRLPSGKGKPHWTTCLCYNAYRWVFDDASHKAPPAIYPDISLRYSSLTYQNPG